MTDADAIKTYVEEGLGIAVVSEVTFDSARDSTLRSILPQVIFSLPRRTFILVHRRR